MSPPKISLVGRVVLVGAVMALGCFSPTSVCGCTPPRSRVYVRGTITDSRGAPVVGARLYLDGVPPDQATSYPVFVGEFSDAQTDAAGAFGGLAYSVYSPGVLAMRAAVVRPGLPDTVRLSAGQAPFRDQGAAPDTVTIGLTVP